MTQQKDSGDKETQYSEPWYVTLILWLIAYGTMRFVFWVIDLARRCHV